MGVGDTFALYFYTSDNGNQYLIKLSALVATAGGFGSPQALGNNQVWPYHKNELRHVYGKNGFKRSRLPCATVAAADALAAAGWVLDGGTSFTYTGYSGEKRKASAIG
jgi:hypothetical protein